METSEPQSRFNRYPTYKDSGVEWLGEIPAHWDVRRLKRLIAAPITDGPHETPEFLIDGVPFLSVDGIQEGELIFEGCRYISKAAHKEYMRKCAPMRDDILLGKAASTGKIARVKVDFEFSVWSPLALIRPDKSEVWSGFLEYALKSPATQAQIDVLCTSNTQKNISMRDIPILVVCMAGLEEQLAITTFLDQETARIDALVAKKERLIELLQEKRAALITRAVTKGLDPNAPMKESGIEWLDQYPAHWIGLPLKRWVAVKITDGPHETPDLVSEGVDFISAEAVSNGRIDFDKRRGFISSDLHGFYCRKCKPVRDDILVCKSGATTGKLARVDVDFEFSVWSPLAVVRSSRSRVQPRFLEVALGSEYVQKQIKRTWSAGTQPNISMGDLEQLYVVAPNLKEQARILAYLDQEAGGFDAFIAKVHSAIDRLRELRTSLISAAVTGKIDVRERS